MTVDSAAERRTNFLKNVIYHNMLEIGPTLTIC
mgnify:CR=1 FL=1